MNTLFLIIKPVIEISILSFVVYKIYDLFFQTKAMIVFYIFFFYIFFHLLCIFLKLEVLEKLFSQISILFFVAVIIVYQQDIRRSIPNGQAGGRLIKRRENFITSSDLDQILNAMYALADIKRGALVVIKRNDKLESFLSKGTKLNCDISSSILLTIFDHDTPLHDGAVIIEKDIILSAGCFLPLTDQQDIKSTYGTRHRAAIGATEETDCLVIVVSEETQKVSVCFNSRIYPDLDIEDCKKLIVQNMGYVDKDEKKD